MDDSSGSEVTLQQVVGPARSRPRALWGALAALAVFGATLAFAAAGDGDGSPRQLPVGLASGGAAEQATADLSMAVPTRYVAADGLPDLGGEATAHRLGAELSTARLESLAEVLALEATPVNTPDGWTIDDGDQLLVVTRAGGLPWSYAGPGVQIHAGSGVGGSEPGSTGSGEQCIERDGAIECSFSETGTALGGECGPSDGSDCTSADLATPGVTTGGECGPADSGVCTVTEESAPTTSVVETGGGECLPNDGPTECLTGETEPWPGAIPHGDCPAAPTDPTRCDTGVSGADLPTREDAERIALEVLAAAGVDVGAATVTVEGPFEAWYVMVEPVVGGLAASGFGSIVAVGPGSEVLHASGHLADPEDVGEYPLLDTRAAIDRLNEQQSGWFAYSPMTGEAAEDATTVVETTVCPDEAVCAAPTCPEECLDESPAPSTTEPCGPDSAQVRCHAPALYPCEVQADGSEVCEGATVHGDMGCVDTSDAGTLDRDLVCRAPEPIPLEPVEVVLSSAEPILLLTPAIDGTSDAYLVPGYRFGSDDGHQVDVMAVSDEALAGTPSTEPAPGPPETRTAPPVCEVIGEGDASGTTHTVVPPGCPDDIQPSEAEPVHLGEGEKPQLGIPYRVELILHCVHLVDWDGRWWGTEAINAPTGWIGGGTFTLTSADEGTYVDDGAPHDPATFAAMGNDYPGCD